MTNTRTAIRSYFTRLGLTAEIADLYLTLHTNGPQTISELSRNAGVERTRIYRLLKQLRAVGLIEVASQYKRSIISAAPASNLQILVGQKQDSAKRLETELPAVQQLLTAGAASSPTTPIQYYQGAQGLRQMLWNELCANTEIMAYSYQIFDEGMGRPFMTKWVVEFEQRNLHKKILFNDAYVKSWHDRPGNRIKGMEYHYINPHILTVQHTCNIYDEVTCYLSWRDGEIFGVEIYNRDIANVQRQLLRQIWPLSQPETRF